MKINGITGETLKYSYGLLMEYVWMHPHYTIEIMAYACYSPI